MSIPYIVGMGAAYTAALWLLVRRLRLPGRGYLPEKTLCSLCFVAVAAVCAALGSRPEAFWRLLPALLCCVAGDVVLALYNKLHRPGLFLAGLGAFLAGHSLFVWGLCQLQPMGWPVPLAAVLGPAARRCFPACRECRPGGCALWWCFTQPLSRRCWARDCSWPLVWASPGAFWCWQGRCCSGFRIC